MSHEQLPPPAHKTAERLAVIVDAAERAALSVIDDAEKEAKRYLEEAQARADRIVAEHLREAADRLEAGDAGTPPLRRVESKPIPDEAPSVAEEVVTPRQAPTPEEAAVVAAPPPVAPPSPARPEGSAEVEKPVEPEKPASGRGGSAAARLLATQMAVSGSSRKEIEMRLRNGFEIEDAGEILDAILGPEE